MSEPFSFGPPPVRNSVPRIENLACRQVLRLRPEITPGTVARTAGLGPGEPLTFRALRDHANFLADPVVTTVAPDPLSDLLKDARNSRMWGEWVATWDLRPDTPVGERVLIAEGDGWDRVVIHDDLDSILTRPGVVIHAGDKRLVLEMLRPWAKAVWELSEPTLDGR